MADTLKQILQTKGAELLADVVKAKKAGVVLPKAVDKIAGLAIKGEKVAIDSGKKYAEARVKQDLIFYAFLAVLAVIIIRYF